jgi:hypothetical protein
MKFCQMANQGASPIGDVIIEKSQGPFFNILPVFMRRWEIQTYWVNLFSRDENGVPVIILNKHYHHY